MRTFALGAAAIALAAVAGPSAGASDEKKAVEGQRFLSSARAPQENPPREASGIADCATGQTSGWGVELKNLNAAIRPGDDFYAFVNHGWLTSTKLPPDRAELGNFTVLSLQADQDVARIIERSATGADASPDNKRIGSLYNSFMDRARVERLGFKVLERDLAKIMGLRSHKDLAGLMAHPASSTIAPMYVFADAADPRKNILHVDQNHQPQPILGLRGREAYVSGEQRHERGRRAYSEYIEFALKNAGVDDPQRRAKDVLFVETQLAQLQWTPSQLRDRRANYNRMSLDELTAYAPGFPWRVYLEARGIGDVKELVLGTDEAIRKQSVLFANTPVDVWKSYLAFHWIDNHSDLLPARLAEERFRLYGPLAGVREQRALPQRGIGFVNGHLGHLVGKQYVELRFSATQRAMMKDMIGNLVRAFEISLKEADWMDEETRSEALKKLAAYKFKVGYPDQWRDYAGVTIKPDDLIGNYHRLVAAEWRHQRGKIDQPVTVDWYQTPQTVNASYNPVWNAIELPAAMLQAPFFSECADPAVNYGAIGSIIAHEMAHAFDDQGSRFDHRGVLRDWWTGETRKRFNGAASSLKAQYANYEPLPGLKLNAEQGVGEYLADLIGVSVAYRAYRIHLDAAGQKSLNEFTPDQRFFMGWAQAWRVLHTEEALRNIVANGYHAPGKYRVNGAVRNLDPWYNSFSVERKAALYLPPEDRVRLW